MLLPIRKTLRIARKKISKIHVHEWSKYLTRNFKCSRCIWTLKSDIHTLKPFAAVACVKRISRMARPKAPIVLALEHFSEQKTSQCQMVPSLVFIAPFMVLQQFWKLSFAYLRDTSKHDIDRKISNSEPSVNPLPFIQ